MADTLNLLPCPFCGAREADVCERDQLHFVMCGNCTAEGPAMEGEESRRYAVEQWNRRAATKAAAPADAANTMAHGGAEPALKSAENRMNAGFDGGAGLEHAREEVQAELLRVGAMMANTMFNLAQRTGDVIDSDLAAKFDKMRKEWDTARRASSVPSIPGTKVVPLVATSDMIHAGMPFFHDKREPARKAWQVYKAMIAAAPSHPSEAKAEEDA